MSKSLKRIQQEYLNLKRSPIPNVSAEPRSEDDLYHWKGVICGPVGTCYEGGTFHLDIRFPQNYPFKAPDVKFETQIYHPNISQSGGEICLDILKDQWAPGLTIQSVLLSISSLLTDPNPDDPLEGDIAELYMEDREEYNNRAAEWVQQYALE